MLRLKLASCAGYTCKSVQTCWQLVAYNWFDWAIFVKKTNMIYFYWKCVEKKIIMTCSDVRWFHSHFVLTTKFFFLSGGSIWDRRRIFHTIIITLFCPTQLFFGGREIRNTTLNWVVLSSRRNKKHQNVSGCKCNMLK